MATFWKGTFLSCHSTTITQKGQNNTKGWQKPLTIVIFPLFFNVVMWKENKKTLQVYTTPQSNRSHQPIAATSSVSFICNICFLTNTFNWVNSISPYIFLECNIQKFWHLRITTTDIRLARKRVKHRLTVDLELNLAHLPNLATIGCYSHFCGRSRWERRIWCVWFQYDQFFVPVGR